MTKRNDIGDSYVLGCSSGSLRCGEFIHPRGRSRRPILESTLHNRHRSARLDAQTDMPARQPLEMPGRYRFHSTRPAPEKRVGVASSVDRQSKAGVNFRHTTRRCLRMTYDLRLAGNDHAGGNPPCPRARSVQCRRFRARMRGRRTLPSPLADACRRRCAIGHSGIGRDDARRCARDLVVRPARRPALRSKRIRICSERDRLGSRQPREGHPDLARVPRA